MVIQTAPTPARRASKRKRWLPFKAEYKERVSCSKVRLCRESVYGTVSPPLKFSNMGFKNYMSFKTMYSKPHMKYSEPVDYEVQKWEGGAWLFCGCKLIDVSR